MGINQLQKMYNNYRCTIKLLPFFSGFLSAGLLAFADDKARLTDNKFQERM
jgi:hypothetical protein